MNTRPLLATIIFISAIVNSVSVSHAAELPAVIDPMATATPPGVTVSAGYLSLTNNTDKAITITNAYSPTIPKIEIHLSKMEGDVTSMEKQSAVTIPPGDTLVFEHGGYHLMLMDLIDPLKSGDVVDVILTTSMGDMLIEMPVKKHGEAAPMKHEGQTMNKEMGNTTPQLNDANTAKKLDTIDVK